MRWLYTRDTPTPAPAKALLKATESAAMHIALCIYMQALL